MSHLDDETIALRALGEHVGVDVRAHLESCEQCRAEVAALERVTSSARAAGTGGLERPAAQVWDRIAEELGLAGEGPSQVPAETGDVRGTGRVPEPTADRVTPGRDVTPLRPGSRWRRRTAWVAAASFLLGVAGTAVAVNLTEREPDAPVVASAALDPLPGQEATGTAVVHEVDGRRTLDVELGGAGPGGFLEVWLLDADAQRLVSLGVLSGESGTFELPPDLDLEEFPVVDVSDEPYDGDPAHSGDSIVRGQLA